MKSYKQGFAEGFRISVVYGLTSPWVFALYYLFVNPGILEFARTAYGMPATASAAQIIATDMLVQVVAAIIFGTIYGAIISYFLKTSPLKKK